MKLRISVDPLRTTVTLGEYQSVAIGRQPPASGNMARLTIGGGNTYVFLSRHALTISNMDDQVVVENRQRVGSGQVRVTYNGELKLISFGVPARIRPVPKHVQVRVELFDGAMKELRIDIEALGPPLHVGGVTTRLASMSSAGLEDWVLAINAVECARQAGGKQTAKAARAYFHGYTGHSATNTRAFTAAYRKAGTLLLGDPQAGHEKLLSVSRRYIDPQLVEIMLEKFRS